MTPLRLLETAVELIRLASSADLVKNEVGNLAILNQDGDYIGFVDLDTGEVTILNGRQS